MAWTLGPGTTLSIEARHNPPTAELRNPTSGRIVLQAPDSGEIAALEALAKKPCSATELADAAQATQESTDLGRFWGHVDILLRKGMVSLVSLADGGELMRATRTSDVAVYAEVRLSSDDVVQLSRFACIRRSGDHLVVESPTACTKVTVCDARIGALLADLSQARSVDSLCRLDVLPPAVTREALQLLATMGVVGVADRDGVLPDDRDVAGQREFHDVLAHWHSRWGLAGEFIGARYRDGFEPLPAIKPVDGEVLPLPRPDLSRLKSADPPLAQVVEERRSVRWFGPGSLTLEQLGEFLYRVGRVRADLPPTADVPYGRTVRPYPSGGQSYDLEIYLTITGCDDLKPGIYHYEPELHGLTLVTEQRRSVIKMVRTSCLAMARPSVPQVLVTLASRFNRLSWRYRGLSYSLTLKNVGVLLQSMYLAATAMGLGGCAQGSGNSRDFAQIIGCDPMEESSVGEFALGVLPPAEDSTEGPAGAASR